MLTSNEVELIVCDDGEDDKKGFRGGKSQVEIGVNNRKFARYVTCTRRFQMEIFIALSRLLHSHLGRLSCSSRYIP